METHNEANTCTMQWVSEVGTTHKGYPEMFIVTYSDSPVYKITYNLNGGISSVSNPYGYEPGMAVTRADPTRTFYEFGGWYDSEDLRDSPITGSDLPNTEISVGKITLYNRLTHYRNLSRANRRKNTLCKVDTSQVHNHLRAEQRH